MSKIVQPTIESVLITPEMAKAFLNGNTGNRRLSQHWVSNYVRQMRAGEWMSTTDTIKISPEGKLLDGQHRLAAFIEYGRGVTMHVAKNVDADTFLVLDSGRKRNTADAVYITGHKHAIALTAIASMIIKSGDGKVDATAAKKGGVSTVTVLEWIEQNPEIHEIVEYVYNVMYRFRYIKSAALAGCMYWYFSRKSMTKADEFFESLAEGVDLTKGSPIRLLRERLMRDYANQSRLKIHEKAALFVYAWNAFRQKREITNLLLPRGSDFPKIV